MSLPYGICGEVAFKTARAMVFPKSGGWVGISFKLDPKNLDFFLEELPLPESTSPKKFVAGGLMSAITI